MRKANCLCGAISFTISGELASISVCHCGQCRRWHGNAGTYTEAPWSAITFAAQDQLRWYRSSNFARRGFCAACGSSLFWERIGADRVSIAAGALESPTGLAIDRHIFVADKPDWYEITDGLKQAAQWAGSG
jgi:hypothetical protein